jgi:type VI secretion system protein ImpK
MSDERFQKTAPLGALPVKPQQTESARPTSVASQRNLQETSLDALAAPVFEMILQLRAGQLAPSNDLRPKIDAMLKHLEERGRILRYSDEQIANVKFALAAFTDETVLTADFPFRHVWEKHPLQLEYFGEHLAGVKFFERLEQMKKNARDNGEVIELYYMCLLLGFKGRYNVYFEEELKGVIRNTADDLRKIGRLVDLELSPHWRAMDQPEAPRDTSIPIWARIGGGVVLVFSLFVFFALFLILRSDVNAALQQLLR